MAGAAVTGGDARFGAPHIKKTERPTTMITAWAGSRDALHAPLDQFLQIARFRRRGEGAETVA